MDRRVLSLGGLALAGLVQAAVALLEWPADPATLDWLQVVLGLLTAGLFGSLLVRGDDANGLARRPLFVAVGVGTGVAATVILVGTLLAG